VTSFFQLSEAMAQYGRIYAGLSPHLQALLVPDLVRTFRARRHSISLYRAANHAVREPVAAVYGASSPIVFRTFSPAGRSA
jgi:hypothetical protein